MKCVALEDIQYQPRLGHGKAVIFKDEDFGANAKVQIVKLGAGHHVEPHVHKVHTELVQILEGAGAILVNGKVVADQPGVFVLVQPGDVHELKSAGDSGLIVAVFRVNDPGDEDMIWVNEEPK